MTPYYVNVSSIQDFEQCRYRWTCKWVLNRVPRHEGPALEGGKLIHRIFEDHAVNDTPLDESARRAAVLYSAAIGQYDEPERTTREKALKIITDLSGAWPLWRDVYPMDVAVLECEEPFEITFPAMPGVVFRGRPDRVCIMEGRVWHVQNRGLAAAMNFGTYARLALRHKHEHLYAEHLSRKYAMDGSYGGTLFNLVRKLKFETKKGKKTAAEMFRQQPVSYELGSLNHRVVMEDMFDHVDEMRRIEDRVRSGGRLPAPNDKMNGGFNGSSEDPFFKLMIGEITLDNDEFFKDREEMYVATAAGEE
jgi:PD-(D/E)XK nuclease superfamily